MKKTKLVTVLSASFAALTALASCNIVKANKDIILTYDGVNYTADDLFNDAKSSASAEAKFNAVYKVAVRQYFNTDETGKAKMEQIKKDANIKVSGQKSTAQSNASKNGTSYDSEWQKILDSNNVENEKELYDKFEYDIQKEEFDNQFYDKNLDILKNGGYLKQGDTDENEKIDGYIKAKAPYHVKHILVKVSAAENDPTRGTITADEADKLSTVIQELANGTSFNQVAKMYSDDTGSKENFGDLGIMDLDTSFVNEFKLGVYMYESFFGSSTSQEGADFNSKNARKELGLNIDSGSEAAEYAEKVASIQDKTYPNKQKLEYGPALHAGIGQIPYEAALKLSKKYENEKGDIVKGYADITFESQNFKALGSEVSDNAAYYPRNVIFNKYFNKGNIMVITPTKLPTINKNQYDQYFAEKGQKLIKEGDYNGGVDESFLELEGFKRTAKNEDNCQNYDHPLRDQNGRVILVFRSGTSGDSSYQGIHFVVVERSPFIGKEYTTEKPTEAVTLDEYYTQYYPGEKGGSYPVYSDSTEKPTYVNYINTPELKDFKSRADSLKSKFKSADSNLSSYIYRYLIKNGDIKFSDKAKELGIDASIDLWIDRKRETSKIDTEHTWDDTWKTYYNKLAYQEEKRSYAEIKIDETTTEYRGSLISEFAVAAYTQTDVKEDEQMLKELFGIGGAFHE